MCSCVLYDLNMSSCHPPDYHECTCTCIFQIVKYLFFVLIFYFLEDDQKVFIDDQILPLVDLGKHLILIE